MARFRKQNSTAFRSVSARVRCMPRAWDLPIWRNSFFSPHSFLERLKDPQMGNLIKTLTHLYHSMRLSQDARLAVARFPISAAQNISVESPRNPTPSADGPHGVLTPAWTSASSVPPPIQVTFSTNGMCAHSAALLGHGPSSATGTRACSAVPPCRGSKFGNGDARP